jgi:hypothetical protein
MSKKTFSTAPKPKNKQLSPEAISAFEQGGAGHDTAAAATKKTGSAGQGRAVAKTRKPAPTATIAVDDTPKKRLSLDLPESIHQRFKTACSATSRKMTMEVQEFIERRTAELETEAGITRK